MSNAERVGEGRKPPLKRLLAHLRATNLMLNRLGGIYEQEMDMGAPITKDDFTGRIPAMVEYRRFVVRRFERGS